MVQLNDANVNLLSFEQPMLSKFNIGGSLIHRLINGINDCIIDDKNVETVPVYRSLNYISRKYKQDDFFAKALVENAIYMFTEDKDIDDEFQNILMMYDFTWNSELISLTDKVEEELRFNGLSKNMLFLGWDDDTPCFSIIDRQ